MLVLDFPEDTSPRDHDSMKLVITKAHRSLKTDNNEATFIVAYYDVDKGGFILMTWQMSFTRMLDEVHEKYMSEEYENLLVKRGKHIDTKFRI